MISKAASSNHYDLMGTVPAAAKKSRKDNCKVLQQETIEMQGSNIKIVYSSP